MIVFVLTAILAVVAVNVALVELLRRQLKPATKVAKREVASLGGSLVGLLAGIVLLAILLHDGDAFRRPQVLGTAGAIGLVLFSILNGFIAWRGLRAERMGFAA